MHLWVGTYTRASTIYAHVCQLFICFEVYSDACRGISVRTVCVQPAAGTVCKAWNKPSRAGRYMGQTSHCYYYVP